MISKKKNVKIKKDWNLLYKGEKNRTNKLKIHKLLNFYNFFLYLEIHKVNDWQRKKIFLYILVVLGEQHSCRNVCICNECNQKHNIEDNEEENFMFLQTQLHNSLLVFSLISLKSYLLLFIASNHLTTNAKTRSHHFEFY